MNSGIVRRGLTPVLLTLVALLVTVVAPTVASAAAEQDRLVPGEMLYPGERLVSPDGRFVLVMQPEGNLVEYAPGNRAVWASGTDHPESVLQMQDDGNLVVYAPGHVAVWASFTDGVQGATAELQNDGNLVVYGAGHVAQWESGVVDAGVVGGEQTDSGQEGTVDEPVEPTQPQPDGDGVPELVRDRSVEPTTESVTGASATCTVPSTLTEIGCDLSDTKADSHSVFIEWRIDDDEDRWPNNNGSDPTNNPKPFREGGLNKDGSASTIQWRVCVDVQLGADKCSGIVVIKGVNAPLVVHCAPSATPSPGTTIPSDLLLHRPNCYPVEPDARFSAGDKCMVAVGAAILGVADESRQAWDIVKSGGKVALKKVGPGVVLTGFGVHEAVSDCEL